MFTGILENFVVFEGCDGSGTSTQMEILRSKLAEPGEAGKGPVFFPCAEPTDGEIGRLIRRALRGEVSLLPQTLAGLFAADRSEHVFAPGGIRERCLGGQLAVCDRYVFSSLVYQGIECGEELPRLLNRRFPAPALLFFFDIDPEAAQERMKGRASLDIFENLDFQKKVRHRYRLLLDEYEKSGGRVKTVDASGTREEVALQVWAELSKLPVFAG